MADVQVTSARLEDGVLTVTGSGFTRTTTKLYVDGEPLPFEVGDDFDGTEITAEVDKARRVWAVKNEIESKRVSVEAPAQSAPTESADQATSAAAGSGEPYDPGGDVHEEGYKTADPNATPGDLVEDDLKTTSDVDVDALATAGSAGAEDKLRSEADQRQMEANRPDQTPLAPGEHLPGADFRFKVQGTFAGDLNQDPRTPYATGNPPDPREEYYRINGFYPADDETAPNQKEAK
jgi:hypothetical protein